MECTRCYTHMQLVKRENHRDSFLEWHQCPLCLRMDFISQPVHYDLGLTDDEGSRLKLAIR